MASPHFGIVYGLLGQERRAERLEQSHQAGHAVGPASPPDRKTPLARPDPTRWTGRGHM